MVTKAPPARQRAPRREPDLAAVLEAAVESLLAHGERGFRIEHIIERTGISRSSLYLHFVDRDGLVEAASAEIFFREVYASVQRTVDAIDSVHDVSGARAIVAPLVDEIAAKPETTRWNRLMVLAASRYRVGLWRRLAVMQTEICDVLTASLERWRGLGILREGIEPRELAAFIQSSVFGRVIRDLDDRSAPVEAWKALTVTVFTSVIAE